MEGEAQLLQFAPFQSTLDAGFWHELGRRKLEQYRLSSDPVDIRGHYTNASLPDLPISLSLDYGAFEETASSSAWACLSPGVLRNTNTLDAFKSCDKKQLLEEAGQKVWDAICTGQAVEDPSLLTHFLLLTYADLKKYNYCYWFAFPALLPSSPVTFKQAATVGDSFSQLQRANLGLAFDSFKKLNPKDCFFLVQKEGDEGFALKPLSAFAEVHKPDSGFTVGFCDPSTLEGNPGWPLRNFLLLLSQQWGDRLTEVDIICYRDYTRGGQRHIEHSLILQGVSLPSKIQDPSQIPKVVGWEKNDKGKLSPRLVNLSSNMDPARLAESAIDLNLKLMRWRLLPSLDLDAIKNTSCLLLGAGTLGCNVARCLMGWGVRNITLVDNSCVSYSNPVRQSLFKFSDCPNGGAKKAEAAANALKEVFPGINSQWVELTIPMPGHSVGSELEAQEQVKADVKKLEDLISSHDVIFLLMDTRESRWLPTLLCAHLSKLCINAALGFDTYMIMRHGVFAAESEATPSSSKFSPDERIPGDRLGCYFCNDVVAPTDSTRDRTLDQQCTVSRPGLSMIASALAVELLVSILQHPQGGLAAADSQSGQDDYDTESGLGLVPHQIRGFLSRFQNVIPASERFNMCTACSYTILSHYRSEGFEFLLKAFNTPNYLEDLTGLSRLYAETLDDHIWELSDDENF